MNRLMNYLILLFVSLFCLALAVTSFVSADNLADGLGILDLFGRFARFRLPAGLPDRTEKITHHLGGWCLEPVHRPGLPFLLF